MTCKIALKLRNLYEHSALAMAIRIQNPYRGASLQLLLITILPILKRTGKNNSSSSHRPD